MKNNKGPAMAASIALTMEAAGGVAYVLSSKNMKSQRKQFKSQAVKAANNISHWAENMSNMMG